MAELVGNNKKKKKRLSISLSLFAPSDLPKTSSRWSSPNGKGFVPREDDGVVGLGIVAALSQSDHTTATSSSSSRAILSATSSPRSNPIPIFNYSVNNDNNINNSKKKKKGEEEDAFDDEMELSEEYTCVISHIGDNLIKKREYFDGVLANETHTTFTSSHLMGGDKVAIPKAVHFQPADFLSSCYLCKKHLHGLDIFMYRGERAFCSEECRCKQIAMDQHRDNDKGKCGSVGGAAMMMLKSFEFSSTTPCSTSPMQLFSGVVAA